MGYVTRGTIETSNLSGQKTEKIPQIIPWSVSAAEKAGFKHFMLKEIFEQPQAICDTLRLAKKNRSPVLSISNIMGSSVVREADASILTRAGLEIGVASTKAFTTQLTVLCLLGLYWAQLHGSIPKKDFKIISERLLELPRQVQNILRKSDDIRNIARHFRHSEGFLFMGRGANYPIALEGAPRNRDCSRNHRKQGAKETGRPYHLYTPDHMVFDADPHGRSITVIRLPLGRPARQIHRPATKFGKERYGGVKNRHRDAEETL